VSRLCSYGVSQLRRASKHLSDSSTRFQLARIWLATTDRVTLLTIRNYLVRRVALSEMSLGFSELVQLVLQQPTALSRPDQHKAEDRQDSGGERQRHAQSWSAGRPHARE